MELLIGWAEESLVPVKKTRLAGQFYERISEYVESPITVTAMAVERGDQQLILMSADLTLMGGHILKLAREEFARICPGVASEALVVSVTHTHTSLMLPPAPNIGNAPTAKEILEEFLPADQQYKPLVTPDADVITPEESQALVVKKIALAAKRAWENRAQAYYANEFGRAAVGMCRRVVYADGSAQMWGDVNTPDFLSLEGGNDSGMELLYTFDKDKKLTGVVANIACPAQILEHRSFISADFWGRAKAILREKLGEDVYLLGLGGAGGDQCPRDLVRWVAPETPINDPNIKRPNLLKRKADASMFDLSGCNRVGKRIANEILSVLEEVTELQSDGVFCHKTFTWDMPLRNASAREYEYAVSELQNYVKSKDSFNFEDHAMMYVHTGTIKRYREQQFASVYPIECHIIRLGDIAMATNPFELFLDYANRIKAQSFAQQTFIIQLCCGSGGYLPTEKAEKGGHYSAYISSGNVGHQGGDLLVRQTLEEINRLFL